MTPDPTTDCSSISDGSHTFEELYEHRHALTLALMHCLPTMSWFSLRHEDDEPPFGSEDWFIVGIQLPTGAITYHLPIRLLEAARSTGATELQKARLWDGHNSSDVLTRLKTWASLVKTSETSTPEPAWLPDFYPHLKAKGSWPVLANRQPTKKAGDLDDQGRCWWGDEGSEDFVPSWRLCEPPENPRLKYWRPYWAIPVPAVPKADTPEAVKQTPDLEVINWLISGLIEYSTQAEDKDYPHAAAVFSSSAQLLRSILTAREPNILFEYAILDSQDNWVTSAYSSDLADAYRCGVAALDKLQDPHTAYHIELREVKIYKAEFHHERVLPAGMMPPSNNDENPSESEVS